MSRISAGAATALWCPMMLGSSTPMARSHGVIISATPAIPRKASVMIAIASRCLTPQTFYKDIVVRPNESVRLSA
jgi:hypothetical protein